MSRSKSAPDLEEVCEGADRQKRKTKRIDYAMFSRKGSKESVRKSLSYIFPLKGKSKVFGRSGKHGNNRSKSASSATNVNQIVKEIGEGNNTFKSSGSVTSDTQLSVSTEKPIEVNARNNNNEDSLKRGVEALLNDGVHIPRFKATMSAERKAVLEQKKAEAKERIARLKKQVEEEEEDEELRELLQQEKDLQRKLSQSSASAPPKKSKTSTFCPLDLQNSAKGSKTNEFDLALSNLKNLQGIAGLDLNCLKNQQTEGNIVNSLPSFRSF